MLRIAFAALVAAHAVIHLVGVGQAFGFWALDALRQPIGRPTGLLWLAAAVVMGVSAGAIAVRHDRWWLPAAIGILLSQTAIVASWADAKAGTIVNVLIAIALVPPLADLRPSSNHAIYQHRVRAALDRTNGRATRPITETDLAHLPPLVRGYLVRVGVVGRHRIRTVRVRFHGAIRQGPSTAWMPFRGEQHSTFDPPERLFFMRATRAGFPLDGLHAFRTDEASMTIRLASLVTVADITGPTLVRSETVTFLNDLCLFAPAALVDAPLVWEEVDSRSVKVHYTAGRHSVSAVLTFDVAGDLVDFRSDDRYQDAGGADRRLPWTTPVSRFTTFSTGTRLPGYGEGWWHAPEGAFAYLRIALDDVGYNLDAKGEATETPCP
jgi:hypothetical protein